MKKLRERSDLLVGIVLMLATLFVIKKREGQKA